MGLGQYRRTTVSLLISTVEIGLRYGPTHPPTLYRSSLAEDFSTVDLSLASTVALPQRESLPHDLSLLLIHHSTIITHTRNSFVGIKLNFAKFYWYYNREKKWPKGDGTHESRKNGRRTQDCASSSKDQDRVNKKRWEILTKKRYKTNGDGVINQRPIRNLKQSKKLRGTTKVKNSWMYQHFPRDIPNTRSITRNLT